MKKLKVFTIITAAFLIAFSSCMKDLDTVPLDDTEITAAEIFEDPAAYREILAKLYAGLAVSGQQGPAGMPDIGGIDEGFGQYLRAMYYHQVLTTDEAVIGWDDQTIKDLVYQSWTASDVFVAAMYYRIFYQIALANEYIRQTTDNLLDDRGVTGELREQVTVYRAEARFLRAYSYWHALDIFGNVPFVTDKDPIGAFLPEQTNTSDLFDYIESELIEIIPLMKEPRTNVYGRVDRAAAWMLLAKLYMNAEVYANQAKYTEALTYLNQVINAGFSLEDEYAHLFNADNYLSDNEIIMRVPYHGIETQTFGGTTFLIKAAIGGDMEVADSGVDDGWGGLRTTPEFVSLFDENDGRAMFFTDGQTLEISNLSDFQNGYAIRKFTNLTRDGEPGSNLQHPDTDWPIFRLADAYLMYAEAVLRGGSGGSSATALELVNTIRERAFGDNSGNITAGQLTLDFILDERGRELYWEGHRRTDLLRYGRFAGDAYIWSWKGESRDGLPTNTRYNLFPIPDADITANPNLVQNPGY
ncbi:MAG: RagB/SusD family nutrient uptake outer membrane protein [Bacteroidia bacterium]|nr:MAG: RagB/SusD family nutrient uptake outer membrane protein [Bacteroidia bacterium]